MTRPTACGFIYWTKDQVFQYCLEWKALVENTRGHTLKALHTDSGGEYTSAEFTSYLKAEGNQHELTVPKTPQDGVSERMKQCDQ